MQHMCGCTTPPPPLHPCRLGSVCRYCAAHFQRRSGYRRQSVGSWSCCCCTKPAPPCAGSTTGMPVQVGSTALRRWRQVNGVMYEGVWDGKVPWLGLNQRHHPAHDSLEVEQDPPFASCGFWCASGTSMWGLSRTFTARPAVSDRLSIQPAAALLQLCIMDPISPMVQLSVCGASCNRATSGASVEVYPGAVCGTRVLTLCRQLGCNCVVPSGGCYRDVRQLWWIWSM